MASFFNIQYTGERHVPGIVKAWLLAGLIMVFFQIVIGGITRLTGSGLSITRWEIVTGTLPPLNAAAWQSEFDLYQQTPQYEKINQGMTLSEFKFIYFWEYFHRLWARLMFFVFIIPFFWFLKKGMLSKPLMPRLLMVVLLAGLEGFFGWIMVASGLIQRPWVNAYNLTLHLTMGMVIFSYLLWTTFMAVFPAPAAVGDGKWRRFSWGLLLLSFFQIALGAMMSGTKAGLFYPTWPDMNGGYMPAMLLDPSQWHLDRFIHYDSDPFMPALIQFLHRNVAYILTALILLFVWQFRRVSVPQPFRNALYMLLIILGLQVFLGVWTLVSCKAKIPVDLGVAHQAGAVLLLSALVYVCYLAHGRRTDKI
jgi:cytochrome c oxidase assembly protein subunit 15